MTWRSERLNTLLRDRRGTMAVELALVAPVLLLILAGLIDTSRMIVQRMQVQAAAQAGADYAQTHGYVVTEIQNAARNATPLSVTASPTTSQACISGRSIVATAAGACPSGGLAGRFVTVQAEAPFQPLMPWAEIVMPATLKAQAIVRVT